MMIREYRNEIDKHGNLNFLKLYSMHHSSFSVIMDNSMEWMSHRDANYNKKKCYFSTTYFFSTIISINFHASLALMCTKFSSHKITNRVLEIQLNLLQII